MIPHPQDAKKEELREVVFGFLHHMTRVVTGRDSLVAGGELKSHGRRVWP